MDSSGRRTPVPPGAGGDEDHKQSSSTSNRCGGKAELTAEWTVHAQLRISRPGSERSSQQFEGAGDQNQTAPVNVVYKWSSEDFKTNEDQSTTPKSGSFRQGGEPSDSSTKRKHESFHSTTGVGMKPPSDSGFSSANARKSGSYGTRCKSTCNIVLSAVADFLPQTTEIPEEPDPFCFNTTASYTISPEQAYDDQNASQNFGATKILAVRDAFSQTSDTESKKRERRTIHGSLTSSEPTSSSGRKRTPYDYRRLTESMLQPPVDEGDNFLPLYPTRSSSQIYQSPTQSSGANSQQQRSSTRGMSGGGGSQSRDSGKKPPRTVHIDVYCTGSEGEDDGNEDEDDNIEHNESDSASRSSSDNPNELESNSTPQTVLDTAQMRLTHQRAGINDIPRRFLNSQTSSPGPPPSLSASQTGATGSTIGLTQSQHQTLQRLPSVQNLGHAITKSSTAEEVNESKQILLKKHMGHMGDLRSKYNLRNRYIRKDHSDDCLSSNYPNSSRSTIRDMTCSSISSAIASTSAHYEDVESSWKETEPDMTAGTSVAQSDSFDYDNSVDRLRIRQMESMWSRPDHEQFEYEDYKSQSESPTKLVRQKRLQDYLLRQHQHHHQHPPDSTTFQDYYDNYSETTDNNFMYDRSTIPERDEPIEVDDDTIHHRLGLSPGYRQSSEVIDIPNRIMYTAATYNKSGSEASTMQSNLSGYTTEYLAKARKFGSVVTALRKPGHHVGPAKNPECQCDSCRRWMAERFQVRGRAFSTGDTPNVANVFWLKRATLH